MRAVLATLSTLVPLAVATCDRAAQQESDTLRAADVVLASRDDARRLTGRHPKRASPIIGNRNDFYAKKDPRKTAPPPATFLIDPRAILRVSKNPLASMIAGPVRAEASP